MRVRQIPSALLVLYACLLGLGLGLGSAYWTLARDHPLGGIAVGPWKAWPRMGSQEADPYARGVIARQGDIPLALGEGLALTATADSAGRPLDSRCAYTLGSTVSQARLWTVTLYDGAGRLVRSELRRSGFTSAEILRRADGGFAIALAREAQPGNWLKLPDEGRFSLVLRLYDTTAGASAGSLQAAALPAIERIGCSS